MEEKYEKLRLRSNIYRKIDQAILDNQSPEIVADLAIDSLADLISYKQISIALFDDAEKSATILAAKIGSTEIELAKGHVLPYSAFGDLEKLRAGETLRVTDASSLPANQQIMDFLKPEGIGAYVLVPLSTSHGLIGTLGVGWESEKDFGQEEIEILTEIGAQLASSLCQAKLNEQNKQQREELSTLLNISYQLSRSASLKEVMQIVIDQSTRVMGLETGAIYLLNGEELILGATTPSLPPNFPQDLRIALLEHHPHIQSAINSHQPVFLRDTQSAELTPQEKEVSIERGLRSLLYLPLKVSSRDIGVLILGTVGTTKEFSSSEIDLARTLSTQMAMAVDNARLFQETQMQADEMEKRVSERTAELEALTQAISHDLRAPLRAIKGFGQILTEEKSGQLDLSGKRLLERMVSASDRLEGMLNGLLSLTAVSSKKLKLEFLDLSEIATKILDEQINAEKNREIEYSIDSCGDLCKTLYSDRIYTEILLSNIISNAIKFTKGKNAAKIKFGCFTEEGKGIYYLSDNGIGFDIKSSQKIFLPFHRLHSIEEFPGFGIGLTVVKKIIDLHNGKIWMESEKDKGTTVFFTVNDLAEDGPKIIDLI